MPRSRTLIALLLATTWCSAVLHEGLEAVGLMLVHEHQAPAANADHHRQGSLDGDHDAVLARNVVNDNVVRPGLVGVLWFALVSLMASSGLAIQSGLTALRTVTVRRRHDPPFRQPWQFAWRCAPESVAPPALV